MSQYLELSDTSYVASGVALSESLIKRASAIIDGYCRRTINVNSYKERILLNNQRGHVSFYPVVEVTSIRGRAQQGLMGNFFGPPSFEPVEPSNVDIDKNLGTVWCGASTFGSAYAELEVEYTSGWEAVPDKVKVACGMIISQLATVQTPNVKAKKDFDFSIEYFGNSMVTPDIADLLSEYKLMFMR